MPCFSNCMFASLSKMLKMEKRSLYDHLKNKQLINFFSQICLVNDDGFPDYYLAKHKPVWDLLKTWSKSHPQTVTTRDSPAQPSAPDSVDGNIRFSYLFGT